MKPGTVNKVKGSEIYGDFVGHDKVTNIIMFQDKEREFVVTHNADIKPVSYFTGRETELQDLRQRIEEGRKSVLVSGMGGIGKTHICRKLFEEYTNKHANSEDIPFCHIGYIEYNGDMGSSLQNCLKYKEQDNPGQNQEAAWKELEYLAADGKLLLFVDNVNVTMKEDEGLKRLKNVPGAVVVTSRRTSFSKEFKTYKIGFLDVKQCKTVYEKIRYEDSGREVPEDEIPDLEYIIGKLAAMHTITVEFLAHLAQTKHWTVKKLRDELEEKGFQLEYKDEEDELVNIQKSYETLYDLSGLTEAEQNILEAFSVFPYIPLSVEICNKWLLADAGVSEEDDILTGLYRKGWLQFDMEKAGYSLHPVFAKFIYEKCKIGVEAHHGLIEACQKCLEIPESGSVMECQKYIPFAENIIEKIDMGKIIEQARFMNSLAFLLYHTGEYKKAEGLFEKAMLIREKVLGKEHPDTATSYNNLAGAYKNQGKYKEAEELYKKAMLIREKVLGEKHPDTAASYNNIAGMYNDQGKYKEAEELYKKALQIREKILGEEHLDTAVSYNNFAGVYYYQKKYKEAEELYKKTMLITEKVLGEEHPSTATSYNNLAGVYKNQGKYKEAEELYKKALLINKKVLGEEHPSTAASYNNLALLYNNQGKYKEAKELYKKALLIIEKVLGEEHPSTATSYNNFAGVYKNQGKYKEAEELYKKALLINKKVLGEEHPSTAASYNNLAGVYDSQGKYKEAEELFKKALLVRKKVLGEGHPSTAISYNNLAGVYESQGKYKISLSYYYKAFKICISKLGLNHPNTQIVYKNFELAYMAYNSEGGFKQWLEEKMKETK